jgi:hypothetical protein
MHHSVSWLVWHLHEGDEGNADMGESLLKRCVVWQMMKFELISNTQCA